MRIALIVGARPNFMKVAPIIRALELKKKQNADIEYSLIHTGQHYDEKLSQNFITELNLPHPHFELKVGSDSHARQTAEIMIRVEPVFAELKPHLVIVVGDVNSTMACAITAKKMGIKVAHVEAGLRSFDMTMPEEINRMLTDSICDYYFTTSSYADANLTQTGIPSEKIFFVGNTMIDSLIHHLPNIKEPAFSFHVNYENSVLLTLHRPSNVDSSGAFQQLVEKLGQILDDKLVLFPVHPRTKTRNLDVKYPANFHLIEPLGYLQFLYLIRHTWLVITDSGGIQEETTYLRKPCITLRTNTERPETVEIGSNFLAGNNFELILSLVNDLRSGQWKNGIIPPYWDGKAGERIVDILTMIC